MKPQPVIRIGSRQSRLALVQTGLVIDRIHAVHPGIQFKVVPMVIRGDRIIDRPLGLVGGKSQFIKELETALLENQIDLAVHNLKDLPASLPEGLELIAFSEREDPRDVLVTKDGRDLASLPLDARVGSGSARRELQLRLLRPDLRFAGLRGNVQTRLDKLDAGDFDALVLASAGLRRLGLAPRCGQPFSIQDMIPAAGQGVLAVEARSGETFPWLMDSFNHPDTASCMAAERAFLATVEDGDDSLSAAHAWIKGQSLHLIALLAAADQSRHVRAEVQGLPEEGPRLGRELAGQLRQELGKP